MGLTVYFTVVTPISVGIVWLVCLCVEFVSFLAWRSSR